MQLLELKEWYNRYEGFWSEWKDYKFNGFNEKDIVGIEAFRDQQFTFNTSQLEIFFEKQHIDERLIFPLINKFKGNYDEYKRWVVDKFIFFLSNVAQVYGWESFFETPIENLRVPKRLVIALSLFNCATVNEIFEVYLIPPYHNEKIFEPLRRFYLQQNPELPKWDWFYDIPIEMLPVYEPATAHARACGCNTFREFLNVFGQPILTRDNFFEIVLKLKELIKNQKGQFWQLIKRRGAGCFIEDG